MSRLVFTNGRIYTATGHFREEMSNFQSAMVVDDDSISYVGGNEDTVVQTAIKNGASVVDLTNLLVVPGLIDAHSHFLLFGTFLKKFDISQCKSLQEIQSAISQYAKDRPELPRLLCRGWHQSITNGIALASDLDGIDPRPIYIESEDLHSTWCSTPAIKELPIDRLGEAETPAAVPRDSHGNPTGLLAEIAQLSVVWPHQMAVLTMGEKIAALDHIFKLYVEAGYTGAIDLAMDDIHWEALQEYKKQMGIPIHIAAHWLVANGCSDEELLARVDKAADMYRKWNPSKDPELCIVGIKLILDGVVDGCTAAVSDPFPGHKGLAPPAWDQHQTTLAVKRATEAGMQVALHAVGDVVITQAINAVEDGGASGNRPRMEHIEFPSEEDVRRMGELKITASVQPGHCDPFTVRAYPEMVGPRLWERAFPYKKFLDGHSVLALGTDAPSASHLPLPTVYTATTRKSAKVPTMTTQTNAKEALTLSQAMHAFTVGAAYSRFAESWTGSLKPGMRADFVVMDHEWDAEHLLKGKVLQTWSKGQKVFQV
ncbi:amidohydrolase 3 [Dactylonectria macrodidyma]|uniref:Amidohydrolase 3 n=1 Tax=Dactylonectria macrodidyma TaxID=307937 RepID=A0A9P9J3K3_9HYPO|nr:amidohydrolase 3 [Dactylonectria macrodidyma]